MPSVPSIRWTGSTLQPLELTLKQQELLNQHPLKHWQSVLLEATRYIDFQNKTILEIGGSNLPREFVFGILGAKKWVCVNLLDDNTSGGSITPETIYPLNHPKTKQIIRAHDFVLFKGSVTEIGKELHNEFDACISVCAFEHIFGLQDAVDCVFSSLRSGGILFTQFGPIWSGPVEHHFWVDAQHNFNTYMECHLPPFVHLLYSASEINELLVPYYTTKEDILIKDQIVEQCSGDRRRVCNGLFYEDYLNIMKDSQFSNISVTPYWQDDVDKQTFDKLRRLYPDYSAFSVNGIQIVAQK